MKYLIQGSRLKLAFDSETLAYSVEAPGASWQMTRRPYVMFSDGEKADFPAPETVETVSTGTGRAILASFTVKNLKINTSAALHETTEDLVFSFYTQGDARCEINYVSFPAPFEFSGCGELGENNLPRDYTVLSRMQGTLIPAGYDFSLNEATVYERDAYMPIFGQFKGKNGYLAVFDTPFDARYHFKDDMVSPLFVTSLGFMAYPRKMLYRFLENADYNDLAAEYRKYVSARGRLVTLKEKIARNPSAARLLGCPVIHEGIAAHITPGTHYYNNEDPSKNDWHTTFETRARQITELRARGLKKAYTHFDGWGNHGYDNLHPNPLPPHEAAGGWEGMKMLADAVNNAGYIFGIHDQYRDYYYDSPDFSIEKAVTHADGSHPYCDVWFGGKHSWLCSALAPAHVRKNYDTFAKMGIDIRAAYLDVFSVVFMDECFHPAHPVTRKECAEHRRECLDILSDRGIIPSSEEILDCILPSQVLCHHAPFFTSDLDSSSAKAVGIPIPLLSLVYHDCAVIPWIGRKGQKGGWGIPGDKCAYDYARLTASPVYISINADETEIAEAEAVCAEAERLAFTPMLRHEFVTPDGKVQKTAWADGTEIVVEF